MLSACRKSPHITKSLAKSTLNLYIKNYVLHLPILQIRNVSTHDVLFGGGNVPVNSFNIPAMPEPPLIKPSIEELVSSGHSVLNELGLWSAWKPSSWLRYGYEYAHFTLDVPWWATIVCGTVILRLLLIGVPIMSQRMVAKQSHYSKEIKEYRDRINDARTEGDQLKIQAIFLEQRDFLRSKGIKYGVQLGVMAVNGAIFFTQFSAIKKMANACYPGFSTEGTLWFPDITACDPYYALPAISAASLFLVMKVGRLKRI